jgi:hypothetical protein
LRLIALGVHSLVLFSNTFSAKLIGSHNNPTGVVKITKNDKQKNPDFLNESGSLTIRSKFFPSHAAHSVISQTGTKAPCPGSGK